MNNILTDEQRERLAEWVGYELLLPDPSSSMCRNPYKEPIFERDDGFMYYSMWLYGDLTSPESYYQVHHILLPKVREKRLYYKFMQKMESQIPPPETPSYRHIYELVAASNEIIIRALLDVLEGE